MVDDAVRDVMTNYPRIFFCCHRRHVRDPRTRKLLSAHQASILDHLDEVSPISLNGLAGHMGVTASTMSIGISRLVERGYVRRGRDDHDGRRITLRLTRDGARIRDAQTVLDEDVLRRMLRRLSADELEEATHGLALLARAAHEEMQSKSKRGRKKARSKQ